MCEKSISDVENVFYNDRDEAQRIYEQVLGGSDADWEEYEINKIRNDEMTDE